jgi:hypothetical protein
MRERRGRIGRTVGALADSLASASRSRGARGGAPRVVIYDRGGHATLLRPGTPEHEQLVDTADRMIGLWRVAAGPVADDDA